MKSLSTCTPLLIVLATQAQGALIAHWKLDETSATNGTSIVDSSGNANNGTLTTGDGSANKSIPGAFAGSTAIEFDGSDDQIVVTTMVGEKPLGNSVRTITAWVNAQTSGDRKFFGYGSSNPGQDFNFTVENDGGDAKIYQRHNGGNFRYPGAAFNSWIHVAVVVPTGATQTSDVKVYINGAESIGAQGDGSARTLNTPEDDFSIGSAGGASYFDGAVDDVQFYDTDLSAAQVLSLYNNPGTVIPEPGAISLASLAMAGFLMRRRR